MECFRQRRAKFMELLGGDPALLVSAPIARRNGDVDYEYRQDSDLYYLTGFPEPESAALFLPGNPARFVLFLRPRDPQREVWDGPRVGLDGAAEIYGADTAFPIGELETQLPQLLAPFPRLHFGFGSDPSRQRMVTDLIHRSRNKRRSGDRGVSAILDVAETLHEMRLRKDRADLDALRRAVEISAQAHVEAMQTVRPGLFEYELKARIEYVFQRHGASWGYPTIVGSGVNACILHYTQNRRRMEDGDLVLVDAGAEHGYMTGDITRTFPVSGRFSPSQRELYDLVLESQRRGIAKARPGATLQDVHEATLQCLVEGMVRIGLLAGEPEAILSGESYRRYFMHRTSHWLGMDVHDVGSYKIQGAWRPLEPGMVLTVEPGLYVSPDDSEAPPRFRGIGIRIEDDLLVTEEAPEILSAQAPKDPLEIEALIQGRRKRAGGEIVQV